MEQVLIKSAVLLQSNSPFYKRAVDVLVKDGKIISVAEHIEEAGEGIQVIDAAGKYLSAGFFDLNVNFGEPGFEVREDLQTGTASAAAGGFTGVAVQPNTQPPVHSKAEVSYIKNQTKENLVDVHPLGAISFNREGKDLAELFDMLSTGAIGFTDGNKSVTDSGLMSRALLYAKGFNGLVFSFPEDTAIAGKGKMNEGIVSTYLGLKGIPALAEELLIARDLYLAEYNDAKIHFSTISTLKSVDLIREAKKKGRQVTCDVAAHHVVLTEDELHGFDSNYKVKPPLRTQEDVKALLEGLQDGTIDAIVSQHTPYEIEHKDVEFEIASFGIIGLQTVLPLLVKAGLSPELIVEKLAVGPRRILGIPVPEIKADQVANFVLFDLEAEWELNVDTNKSKSSNSPFWGKPLKGKAEFVYNNNKFFKV